MSLAKWQAIYLTGAAIILPVAPILFLQGRYTRRKIGVLPEAAGEKRGRTGDSSQAVKLLVIGESTVAGLGARDHRRALAGRFADELAHRIGMPVEWTVVGRNGVTARRTIEELLPLVPAGEDFEYILVGLGGNDVIKLSSPRKWRRDMTRLLGILREKYPRATVFITNCPMIKSSPVLPQPIKFLLWELSKLHDANIKEFTSDMDRIFYYHQPRDFRGDDFFADGIHPSEQGYADWSAAMMRFFDQRYKW